MPLRAHTFQNRSITDHEKIFFITIWYTTNVHKLLGKSDREPGDRDSVDIFPAFYSATLILLGLQYFYSTIMVEKVFYYLKKFGKYLNIR